MVTNRYLRLLPRFLFCVVVFLLPLIRSLKPAGFLGIMAAGIQGVVLAEFVMGMEKGARFLEPRRRA